MFHIHIFILQFMIIINKTGKGLLKKFIRTFSTGNIANATIASKLSDVHFKTGSIQPLQSNLYYESNTPSNEIYNTKNIQLLEKSLEAVKILNKLESDQINTICRFFQYYTSDSKNHQNIIKQIQQYLQPFAPTQSPRTYFKQLEIVLYFFDHAEIGFLKGDIHANSLFQLQNILTQKLKVLQDKKSVMLSMRQFYIQIFQTITDSSNFRLPKNGILDNLTENPRNLYERQLILEQESNQLGISKLFETFESLHNIEKSHELQASKKYISMWFPMVVKAIYGQQQRCRDIVNQKKQRAIYAEYLIQIDADKLAIIALTQLMKEILRFAMPKKLYDKLPTIDHSKFGLIYSNELFKNIGTVVNNQLIYDYEQRKFLQIQRELQKKWKQEVAKLSELKNKPLEEAQEEMNANNLDPTFNQTKNMKYMKPQMRKQYLQKLSARIMRRVSYQRNQHSAGISKQIQISIGSLLTYIIKEIVKIENVYGLKIPLLTVQYNLRNNVEKIIMFKINDYFIKTLTPLLEKSDSPHLHMERSLPTIYKPSPWVDYEIGGYYLRPTSIMRYSETDQQQHSLKFADLKKVSSVLNILGNIPWKINKKVLNIIEKIWENGGAQGTIPNRYSENLSPHLTQLENEKDYKKHKELAKKIQNLRDQHSLRCDFGLKLNVARSFAEIDKIYFPHNLDFRGRVYPVPPHLNHIGADLPRGLLLFSQGKRLGESGLKWLKIHCANLMGHDKATIQEKIIFVHNNLNLIKAIGEDPIINNQWLNFQDCWQAIAAIIQLSDALKEDNPENFISYLHIHQDGSCNGLQHYAALGRDIQGAVQVNLDAGERPSDLYTYVSKMVIKMIQIDVANTESPNHKMAVRIQHSIKRKTVKQTVMTSVYGVTFIGAREQIARQLDDGSLTEEEIYNISIYLARCTMQCIKTLFTGAHQIKRWLKQCAGIIANTGNPVSWITPMGLPIIQPYRTQTIVNRVTTLTQSLMIHRKSSFLPINKNRQRSAFPPNFIHSLDATHMMYTALACHQQNLAFAAVHDSYWTHASSVQKMNKILREQFIRLHSQPLLENLRESFLRRYPNLSFPEIPERGTFDLNKIRNSLYFFS